MISESHCTDTHHGLESRREDRHTLGCIQQMQLLCDSLTDRVGVEGGYAVYVLIQHAGEGCEVIGFLFLFDGIRIRLPSAKPQLVPGIEAGCVQHHYE